MFQPFRLSTRRAGLTLHNRVVVSPMDMYVADDGLPNDFHLVHLGGKALGGAGLVMTEMVCVSPNGRITPGCTGIWTDEQRDGWRRIADFVHARVAGPASACSSGHSGRKGSTKLMWEGIDEPLPEGNWQVVAPPRRCPTGPASTRCRASSTAPTWRRSSEQFVAAARRGAEAGFDLLELHCAHGYLLSVVHLAAHQPAHRRVRRLASRRGCATRSRCSPRCARSGRPTGR